MKEDKDELVCVFKGDAFESEVVRARLEADGIPAMIMNNSRLRPHRQSLHSVLRVTVWPVLRHSVP